MNDESKISRAAALAEWTQLSDARFGECYIAVRHAESEEWEVIVAMAGYAPKRLACDIAEAAGFLEDLTYEVVHLERRAKRRPTEIAEIQELVLVQGEMQAIINKVKGFSDPEVVLPSLIQARDACAMVVKLNPGTPLGSAFLVREDLVLTAAHVVMEVDRADNNETSWTERLKDGLAFRFRSRRNEPSTNMVQVLPAKEGAIVSTSAPYGSADGALNLKLCDAGGKFLDFALIRLAQRVGHVRPVDVSKGASVMKGKVCWAFGYPGGNALAMDVDVVTEVSEAAGRWLHKANSDRGMSGGCCINHEGHVAGLHEGSLSVKGEIYANRGVSIKAIRRWQLSEGPDPLGNAVSTPGIELSDPTTVEEFYRVGLRLVGDTRATQWRGQVAAALGGVDLEGGAALPSFHPWFPRPLVDAWIRSAGRTERICLIHGDSGVGKSFCARLLKEHLNASHDDLLVFSPTQVGAMSWSDAISQVLVPEDSDHRTSAASVRYRDFDEVIRELSRRAGDGLRTNYVVLDMGGYGGSGRFVGTQWFEFVAALAAVEWMRLMIIGLDEYERFEIIDRLEARSETKDVRCREIELRHITRDEFHDYVSALAVARGWSIESDEKSLVVNAVYRSEVQIPDQMRTITAALAAIKFEVAKR